MMGAGRKIIHVDMDAFYAAVEQRDNPALRGCPVIVGGQPNSRGVVSTASYEARKFGIHSAMPTAHAYRLCPHGVFLSPDFSKYVEASRQIRDIFESYTDLVEPLSLDEAFLDVTENKHGNPSATRIAEAIRADILRETRLTASAGIGPNKFIAKVASDMNKPDGIYVVRPEEVAGFLESLPVRRIPGIGRVTEEACKKHGIAACGDFLPHSEEQLLSWFGSSGSWFYRLARGQDDRPVSASRDRKSCGIEDTFSQDLHTVGEAVGKLEQLARGLEKRLAKNSIRGRTVTLKVKYDDFTQITRSRSLHDPVDSAEHLLQTVCDLIPETDVGERPVRLLGISLSHLEEPEADRQLLLPFYENLLAKD